MSRCFESFTHEITEDVFEDGGLSFNNPACVAVNERRLLWPENTHPDMFLSIGTSSTPDSSSEDPEVKPS